MTVGRAQAVKRGFFWARRYVSSNPQYADSAAYAGRFRALQARALSSLRSRVQSVLRHAAEQARAHRVGSELTSFRTHA